MVGPGMRGRPSSPGSRVARGAGRGRGRVSSQRRCHNRSRPLGAAGPSPGRVRRGLRRPAGPIPRRRRSPRAGRGSRRDSTAPRPGRLERVRRSRRPAASSPPPRPAGRRPAGWPRGPSSQRPGRSGGDRRRPAEFPPGVSSSFLPEKTNRHRISPGEITRTVT